MCHASTDIIPNARWKPRRHLIVSSLLINNFLLPLELFLKNFNKRKL